MSCLSATLTNAVFAYLCICICVYVFVYLQVRHPGTLFLRYAVFAYLCICICVFASQTPGNIVFEVLLPLPFQKYSTCHVYPQLWPMLYSRICVFAYLCICICVFASQTPINIVSEVLLPLPFQKYSTCHVYLHLWPMLYLLSLIHISSPRD